MTDTERRLAAVLAEHRLTFWPVYHWKDGGQEVAPRCTCGVLWSAGDRDNPNAQIERWEAHLAVALLPVVAEIEAEARAGERERVAAAIAGSCRRGFGMSPDGTEDPTAAAYVEGLRDAWAIARDAEGSPTKEGVSRAQKPPQERLGASEGTTEGSEGRRTAHSDPIIRHDTPDEGGQLDEFIARGCDIHLEAMGESQWWIGVTTADGREWAINLGSVSGRAKGYARVEEDA